MQPLRTLDQGNSSKPNDVGGEEDRRGPNSEPETMLTTCTVEQDKGTYGESQGGGNAKSKTISSPLSRLFLIHYKNSLSVTQLCQHEGELARHAFQAVFQNFPHECSLPRPPKCKSFIPLCRECKFRAFPHQTKNRILPDICLQTCPISVCLSCCIH